MESEDVARVADSSLTQDFLRAEDLLSLRKPAEEPVRPIVGEKYYTRSEFWLEDKAVDSALQGYKDTLDQKCGARICDLMRAEWNEELKVSITDKLKGKFVQHMGRNVDGKVALLPEESVFLLENGCIEIINGGAPMSTEEAYSVMLGQDLEIEKYQVYSRLSQLGFVVVPHNNKLGVTIYEKKMNLSKHQIKNKRKKVSEETQSPHQKRLTFLGALDGEQENKSSETSENQEQSFKNNFADGVQTVIPSADNSNCLLNKSQLNSSPAGMSSPNLEIVDSQQSESSKTGNVMNAQESQVIDPVSIDNSTNLKLGEQSGSVPDAAPSTNYKAVDEPHSENGSVDSDLAAAKISKRISHGSEVEDRIEDNKAVVSEPLELNKSQESVAGDRSSSRNEIDIMDVDSQGTEISCCTSEIESVRDGFPVERNGTKSSLNNDPNGENDEIMSCSSREESEVSEDISLGVDSRDSILEENDDEITLLEVTKKSSEPLAVIDLLSDNEEQPEENANSDDEITVVKVCSGPSSSQQLPSIDHIKSRKFYDCKKEERSSTTLNPKVENPLVVQFPDLFRKGVVCVARPPLNLLPSHVKPSKEAYILDLKQKSELQPPSERRVWNSFRDLQDYQRSRRLNRHSNQNFEAWNQNRTDRHSRPYESSSRDQYGLLNRNTPNPPNIFTPHRMNTFNSPPTAFQSHIYPPDTTSINSMVSFQHQDMNLSLVRNQSLSGQTSNFSSPNIPNFQQIRAEVQRTALLVTSSVLSSMFGSNLDRHNLPVIPAFANTFPSHGPGESLQNPYRPPLFNTNFRNDDSFRWRGPAPRGKPFPCHYRNVGNKRSWEEIKAAVGVTSGSPTGSDIEEVPISPTDVLWDTGNICPLVKAGVRHPTSLVLESVERIPMAKLMNKGSSNIRCFPEVCSVEISYDVYLPGFNYKKTCPDIPKHRIIVVRSTDPVPKYSEIAFLQRKWRDGAMLQLAIVDNGDVSFMSFNSICLPKMTPHEK